MKDVPCENEQPTIIVVDDDQENARLLKTILQEEAHCRTCTYSSGSSLLEHLDEVERSHPALFLVDYHLPGIDGLSLCKRLSLLRETHHIPTLLVTGTARGDVIQETEQQGITVLSKPFDLDRLLEIIEQEIRTHEEHELFLHLAGHTLQMEQERIDHTSMLRQREQ